MAARVNTLLFLVAVALTVVAVIDCLATERGRVRHFPRGAWLVLVVLCPVVGAIAWFRAGRMGAGEPDAGRTLSPMSPMGPAEWIAPVGPEDDPEFVRMMAEAVRNR